VSSPADAACNWKASLLADEGAASVSQVDFFRSSEFLRAEGVTHSLQLAEADEIVLSAPLTVRGIPRTELSDGISPYGFPGFSGTHPGPVRRESLDWSGIGLVSILIRNAVGREMIVPATQRGCLWIHDPSKPRHLIPEHARLIRRCAKLGLKVRSSTGPSTVTSDVESFVTLYEETMRRVGASERYNFSRSYFQGILRSCLSWLILAEFGEQPVAGAIMVLSDGMLHYYLAGSTNDSLRVSPMRSVVDHMVEMAGERGIPLNLGGGYRADDGLSAFKRGFANRSLPFETTDVICDEGAYERLVQGGPRGSFFPSYRAS
jgi:hypothetical protein